MEGVKRPKATVLPESSLVPERNLIRPAPNQFTHELESDAPYYYARSKQTSPDGVFSAGTKVVLLERGDGPLCHVADGRGLYVATRFDGLRRIE